MFDDLVVIGYDNWEVLVINVWLEFISIDVNL